MARILLADDNREVLVMLSSWLNVADQHTVDTAADGKAALDFALSYKYEVFVLDWEMPEMSGVEVCRIIKQKHPDVPILMLTGRGEVRDRIEGLDAGADDYLTKPFSAEELSARIRALLRRSAAAAAETAQEDLVSGSVTLIPASRNAYKSGTKLQLTPTEFNLLEFFMRHPGQSFSPEALLAQVWGNADDATIASVRTTINRLRGKLDESGKDCPIATERGAGYRWEVP